MKPRHPIAGLDRRPTPAVEARAQLLLVSAGIIAGALVLIFALVVFARLAR